MAQATDVNLPTPSPEAATTPPQASAASPSPAPPPAREVGPGFVHSPDGKPLEPEGELAYVVLETDLGGCTVGCWPSLQPSLGGVINKHGTYVQAKVTLSGQDFVGFVPVKALDLKPPSKAPKVKPAPALAYANRRGDLLISLTDAAPPQGFHPVGQAVVDLNIVDAWRASKAGITVTAAGGLKT